MKLYEVESELKNLIAQTNLVIDIEKSMLFLNDTRFDCKLRYLPKNESLKNDVYRAFFFRELRKHFQIESSVSDIIAQFSVKSTGIDCCLNLEIDDGTIIVDLTLLDIDGIDIDRPVHLVRADLSLLVKAMVHVASSLIQIGVATDNLEDAASIVKISDVVHAFGYLIDKNERLSPKDFSKKILDHNLSDQAVAMAFAVLNSKKEIYRDGPFIYHGDEIL